MVFLVPLDAFFHCAIDEHDVMPSIGMRIFVWETVEGLRQAGIVLQNTL